MASSEKSWEIISDKAVVGSATSCDIVITNKLISRVHCAIHKTSSGYIVEDLGSKHGTFVDKKAIFRKTRVSRLEQIWLSESVQIPVQKVLEFFRSKRHKKKDQQVVFTVGRLSDNDFVLAQKDISAKHARVIFKEEDVFIEDLGSRNGTFLNSNKTLVTRAILKPTDVIVFSKTAVNADVFFQLREQHDQSNLRDGKAPEKTAQGDSPPVAHGVLNLSRKHGKFIIGRQKECDFPIEHPMVSLKHAELSIGETTTIKDLGSSNGTFVNGVRVRTRENIQAGDCISIGPVWFLLSSDGSSLLPSTFKCDVAIEAHEVTVALPDAKKILSDVTLSILPGELVGIMGPSGAGKSTLISVLNGYLAPTLGNISINGRDLYENYEEFRGTVGYVPQDDIMHPDLTVVEALYFSARLRLPTDYSDTEIFDRISKVLAELGLKGTENTRIGNAQRRGVSGGQRKRVNVAMELLTDPPILFLDEPTSGLSSEDACSLMRHLEKLTRSGKTVVLTIHQPNLEIFQLIDNLVIIGRDTYPNAVGRLVYSGPAYPDAIKFFEPRPQKILAPEMVLRGLTKRSVSEWQKKYKGSSLYKRYLCNRLQQTKSRYDYQVLPKRQYVGGIKQYVTLVRRGITVKLKDTWNTAILILQAPVIAVLIGLVFGPTISSIVTIENFSHVARATATVMFLLSISALWFGCSNSAREIVSESAVYMRERMAGLSIPSYVLSKITILSLLCFFQCGVLLLVVSCLGSLSGPWLKLYFAIFIASLVGVAIGLLVSAIARTNEVASAVLPLIILPMVILGGILLPLGQLPTSPIPVKKLADLMPSRWAFELVTLAEASSRPMIDLDTIPPLILSESHAFENKSEGRLDMASDFFNYKDRNSYHYVIVILVGQTIFYLTFVGIVLVCRDR